MKVISKKVQILAQKHLDKLYKAYVKQDLESMLEAPTHLDALSCILGETKSVEKRID